jgi:hypothetical protein
MVWQSRTGGRQLQWAIEEFRKRKIAAINAQLRELRVDSNN